MATMLSDKDISEAVQRLSRYRENDTLTDILNSYETLLDSYRRLKSDYEEERDSRERYKQRALGQERNPFVLVLVDADGYVFNDALIQAGAAGGTQAAQLLNESIKASVRRKSLENCDIMVRVYANVAGLSKALSKVGLATADKRSLAPFIANFNRSHSLTDFIDAGELKENADFKLRGLLRLYAENAQCKHIYFAACHDAGYVSELTQYRNSDRFTLIRTSGLHFHDEFTKLGLAIEELPGVFRATGSAMDSAYPKPAQPAPVTKNTPPVAPSSPAASKNPTSSTGEFCHFYRLGKCRFGDQCKHLHATLPTRSKLSRDWRCDSGSSDPNSFGPPINTRDSQSKSHFQKVDSIRHLPDEEDIPSGQVAVNQNNQRLDAYITPPTADAEARLKERTTSQRLCNAKHLSGICTNINCDYDHGPLEEDLKPALEWLSRSLPCPKRSNCRNATCTFGHVCQKPDCKFRGGRVYCKLGWNLHIDDLSVDRYVAAASSRQTSTSGFDHSSTATTPVSEGEEDKKENRTSMSFEIGMGAVLVNDL